MTRVLCSFIVAALSLTFSAQITSAGENPCGPCRVISRFGGVKIPDLPKDDFGIRFMNPTLADCDLACLRPALEEIARGKGRFFLNLSFTNVTDAGLAELADLTSLHDLDLSSTHVHGYGLRQLASLANLTHLRLNYDLLTLPELIAFVKEFKGTRIRLYLRHTNVLGTSHQPTLTQFALGLDTCVCKVSGLDLSDNQLDDPGLTYLCKFTNLKMLNLAENKKVTAEGLNFSYLKELYLSGVQVTENGLKSIGQLKKLETLDLSNTGQPKDTNADTLGKLDLTILAVAGAKDLSDKGLPRLLSGRASKLTALDMSGTPTLAIDERWWAPGNNLGIKALCKLGELQKLKFLSVSGTGLSNRGLKTIGTLASLVYLDVSKTVVTDKGLDYLKSLVQLTNFIKDDTGMTNGANARLRGLNKNYPTTTVRQAPVDLGRTRKRITEFQSR
jgi:internalin A